MHWTSANLPYISWSVNRCVLKFTKIEKLLIKIAKLITETLEVHWKKKGKPLLNRNYTEINVIMLVFALIVWSLCVSHSFCLDSFPLRYICTQSLWSLGMLLELQQKSPLLWIRLVLDLLKAHWQNSAALTRPTFPALHAVHLICTTITTLHRYTFRAQKQTNTQVGKQGFICTAG